MKYDFSRVDRYGTDCIKFDFARERGVPEDALSYWVADMDWKTAPEILEALTARVAHGIFGYTNKKSHYAEAVISWYKNRFGYEVEERAIVTTPGVVFALATAVQAFTNEGDAVLIQRPVYYPFSGVIRNSNRRVVSNSLVWNKGRYEIDFDDFEEKIVNEKVKIFLLCNPHNPGGRSWTHDELSKMAEICLQHKVLVVSDEIHSDFIWGKNNHTVFASLSKEVETITITCTSPSKTFNLAGLQVSNNFIASPDLKRQFFAQRARTGYDEPSLLGLTACEAAYTKGSAWLDEARQVIYENLKKSVAFINAHGNGKLHAEIPEATYLLWVDCRGANLLDKELNERILNAKLWLDPGSIFGVEGEGFERFNVATSWEYLEEGLKRFCSALG